MIRIIHLTDFHLNPKTLRDWKNYIKDALLLRLRSLDKKFPVTFIAFTGDLIDLGGKEFADASVAFKIFKEEVIQPIINEVGLSIDKFLIIPGNHDVVRASDNKRIELGNRTFFKENYDNISEFMSHAFDNNNYDGMQRIKPYKDFEKSLYENIKEYDVSIFGSTYKFNFDNESIGICCLNSAWRCYDQFDKGRLILGEEQLVRATAKISKCDIKIALLHHPLDWLLEDEREVISNHISKDFDILLLGHIHSNKTSLQTGVTGTLFINVAPSGLNDIRSDSKTYSNGFTIIDFDKGKKEIDCEYFKYNHDLKKFVANTDVAEEGKASYVLTKKSHKKIALEQSLIENIKQDHFKEMDEHLIGTKAEKSTLSIKEGFILPPINQGASSEEEAEEITDLTLAEIMKTKMNLMFFGDQESGKTTLLFRIVRELVDEYSYIQKIPVYVDFDELGNKEFTTIIKDYLRCSSEEARALLKDNRLVLLLDNLNYRKHINGDQRNKIYNLNKEYESIQIIATAENYTSGILPTDYLELCKIPFKNYFIKNLRAKEIKCIMKQWLPNEDEINSDMRLEKLVSSFNSYALPSSAMSVSLFLWSMEYPERKPINNAVLLEIYIEILLQKLGKSNIYRENFDFTNKVQLLSKIAQEMLKSTEANYSILFSELQSIVEKYLVEQVGFDFDANIIINYFLERRLFVKHQQNRVKFTYSCFFHFFIAKRMIFSSTFKAQVLNETEYYKFSKEIDYYTGLTRSDEDLLKLMLERFEKGFTQTDFIYDEVDFDEYFTDKNTDSGEPEEPIAKDMDTHRIKANRPTVEMVEAFYNRRLEQIPNPGVILRKNASSISLEGLLIMMANVLRNSEGVENKALKERAYNLQIKYSLVWTLLYREYLIDYVVKNNELPPSIPKELDFIQLLKNLPVSVQRGLNKHLGTPKLAPIISTKMKVDLVSKTTSDVETFMSVALYADVRGQQFQKYLKTFVKSVGKNIVRDYLFYKILDFYYRRTRPGSDNETIYLDLLSELRIKTNKLPQRMKLRVRKTLEEARKNFEDIL